MSAPAAAVVADNARVNRVASVAVVLVSAFRRVGLPDVWGIAFARQESDFYAQACNKSAADAKRGYSWGLCQMSLQTATDSLGYRGDGPGLTDPSINAALAAKFCRQLVDSHHLPAGDLANVASLYNSGRLLVHAPTSTATTYVPHVLAYAKQYAALAETVGKSIATPTPIPIAKETP